eukprot:21838_5
MSSCVHSEAQPVAQNLLPAMVLWRAGTPSPPSTSLLQLYLFLFPGVCRSDRGETAPALLQGFCSEYSCHGTRLV